MEFTGKADIKDTQNNLKITADGNWDTFYDASVDI